MRRHDCREEEDAPAPVSRETCLPMSRWDTVCDLPNSHVSSCIWNHWPSATISVSAFWCLGDRDLISGVLVIAVMVCDLVEVLAVGDEKMLCRPCVDCGLRTGRFCDFCLAADRMPSEVWAEGQLTPLCGACEAKPWGPDGSSEGCCHFCRGVSMARPFERAQQ